MADQDKNLRKALNKLTVDVVDQEANYKALLKTFKRIKAFFIKEEELWGPPSPSGSQMIASLRSYLAEITRDIEKIEECLSEDELNSLWSGVENDIKRGKTRNGQRVLYSETKAARLVRDLQKESSMKADGAYHYFNNTFFFDLYKVQKGMTNYTKEFTEEKLSQYFSGYLAAHDLADGRLPDGTKSERESIRRIKEEIEAVLGELTQRSGSHELRLEEWEKEITTKLDKWHKNSSGKWNSFLEKANQDTEELKNTYTRFLELAGPTKYWRDRAKSYRRKGWLWLSLLSFSVAGAILVLGLFLYDLPEVFKLSILNGDPGAIKGILILAAIVSFAFYLIRVFSRLTFSSFHIERDAEEHEQLTMVYIALHREKEISEKERDIIIQSLFSRVETGLLGSDSSPSMPGLQSLIEKMIKSAK